MTIIIVDDDEAILEVTSMLFEHNGWTVYAYSEFPGLEQLEKLQPDLLLLDYWMSGLSGREMIKALQQHAHLSAIPRIIMSAMQKIETQISDLEVAAIVKKPFDIDELLSTAASVTTPS